MHSDMALATIRGHCYRARDCYGAPYYVNPLHTSIEESHGAKAAIAEAELASAICNNFGFEYKNREFRSSMRVKGKIKSS
jgi:hypothetical protein